MPVVSYRCPHPLKSPKGDLFYEEKRATYWFCSPVIELESKVPISIVKNDTGDETNHWVLEISGVTLSVDVEHDWLDLRPEGWQPAEIEDVVYADVFGRSARRAKSNRVLRQTDLIFKSAPGYRVQFRYQATLDQARIIDPIIDRTHVPICFVPDCEVK